jgi:hypothetical protein
VRRRDGSTMDGGYRHGDLKFSVPLQAKAMRDTCVDRDLAASVVKALEAQSSVANRLMPALSLFNLANTDSDVMQQEAEVILTGAAFEQLMDAYGAKELSEAVARMLQPYAGPRVAEVMAATRPGIVLEAKYADEQKAWPVHRKWVQELYHLRNAYIHGLDVKSRTWGWNPLEHLIMGAFAFPLLVKVLLAQEGSYKISEDDEGSLIAIDKLLAVTGWGQMVGSHSNATGWQEAMRETKHDLALHRAIEEAVEELNRKGAQIKE